MTQQLEEAYRGLLEQYGVLQQILPPDPRVVERELKILSEEMRASAMAQGIDLPPAELTSEQKEAILTRGPMNSVLDGHARKIERAINRLGLSLPMAVYPGVFPIGSVNAQARAVPGGALLLVNVGLMMLVHQTAKIMMFAVRFTDYGSDGGLVEHPVLRNLSYTRQEIIDAISEVVFAYLTYRDSEAARRFPVLGEPRSILLGMLVESAESFALAHEYGHVVSGHLADAPVKPGSDVGVVEKRREQEFEADAVAAKIALAIASEAPRDDLRPIVLENIVAGPLFFFALDRLIDRVGRSAGPFADSQTSDHPPPVERAEALRAFYAANDVEATSFATAYDSWIAEIEEDVVSTLRRQVDSPS